MEDLINKLIEIDRQARAEVSRAKKARSKAVDNIEKRKKELAAENEVYFTESVLKEKTRCEIELQQKKAEIDENEKRVIEKLNSRFEKMCGEWVDSIVSDVSSAD